MSVAIAEHAIGCENEKSPRKNTPQVNRLISLRISVSAALVAGLPAFLLAITLAACGPLDSPNPTPLPADSPSPTSTLTPQPTATTITSPTPPPAPSATPETLIQEHPDGSIGFVDLKVGYTITFPSGWIIVEMTEKNNDEVFSAASGEFPDLHDRIAIFALTTPDVRIFALNTDPELIDLDAPPIMGILIADSPISLSLDFMLSVSTQALSNIPRSGDSKL